MYLYKYVYKNIDVSETRFDLISGMQISDYQKTKTHEQMKTYITLCI